MPNGVYIAISHGQPSYRLTYLQRPEFGWNVKTYTVQKPMMGMTASLSADDKENVHYINVSPTRGCLAACDVGAVMRITLPRPLVLSWFCKNPAWRVYCTAVLGKK